MLATRVFRNVAFMVLACSLLLCSRPTEARNCPQPEGGGSGVWLFEPITTESACYDDIDACCRGWCDSYGGMIDAYCFEPGEGKPYWTLACVCRYEPA